MRPIPPEAAAATISLALHVAVLIALGGAVAVGPRQPPPSPPLYVDLLPAAPATEEPATTTAGGAEQPPPETAVAPVPPAVAPPISPPRPAARPVARRDERPRPRAAHIAAPSSARAPTSQSPGEAPAALPPVETSAAGDVPTGTGAGTTTQDDASVATASAGSAAPHPVREVAAPPELVERVVPDYPPRARAMQIEGQVALEVVIDRDGRVEEAVRVTRSIPALDAAAIAAVRRWRFRPAHDHDGRTVRVIMEIPVRFVLR